MSNMAHDGIGNMVVVGAMGNSTAEQGGNSSQSIVPTSESTSSNNSDINNLNDEFHRLKSFPLQWNSLTSKKVLASQGFYYIGDIKVKCILCQFEIQADNNNESIHELHLQERPSCDLANGRSQQNIPLGNVKNFRSEKNRIVSFLESNWTAPVDVYDLAKWGFFWTGIADVGRCVFCRLEVRGWEPGDSGRGEHLKWNPNCPFMQDQAVGNIILGQENTTENVSPDRIAVVQTGPHDVTAAELGVVMTAPPRHADYAALPTRLASYAMWPLSMKQRPEELSEAGFYYTSKGDRVICYHCGGGLKDWGQTDLPWVEHAVWFPRCPYLIMKKGQTFVSHVQALKNAQLGNAELQDMTQSSISSHLPAVPTTGVSSQRTEVQTQSVTQTPTVPTAAAASALPTAAGTAVPNLVSTPLVTGGNKDNPPNVTAEPTESTPQSGDDARDLRTCKVCYQKELGIVFLPCGHMATCPDCAPQLTSCPICRARTNAYVRAFLP